MRQQTRVRLAIGLLFLIANSRFAEAQKAPMDVMPPAASATNAASQPYDAAASKTPAATPIVATVTRNKKTLAAARVPNLLKDDKVAVQFSKWDRPGAPHRFHVVYGLIEGNGVNWTPRTGDLPLFNPVNDAAPSIDTLTATYDGAALPVFFICLRIV
jgi:hypothetical protein